jgi:arabinofuranosyltransferase
MSDPAPTAPRSRALLGLVVLAAFAVLLVRNGWVSDDAFITLRTVDNALNGGGLRWNIAERVQSYTHPLWMFVLLIGHAVTGEPYYGTLVLGGLTSLAAMAVLWFGVARDLPAALLASVPLLVSKAFIDYGTSGLENPLTHLLLALLALIWVRTPTANDRRLLATAGLTGLALLTRPDLAVLFGPALAVATRDAWRAHRAVAGPDASWTDATRHVGLRLLVGLAPLLAWEVFAFVYYGSLVPNTAYAKLGTGIPRQELIAQGLRYLQHAGLYDRPTLLVLACGLLPLAQLRTRVVAVLCSGAAVYALYVVWIGGDFMAGRFLTAPLFAVSLAIARMRVSWLLALGGLVVQVGVGLASPHAPVWSGADYDRILAWNGIVDERGFYHDGAGFLTIGDTANTVTHPYARAGRRMRNKARDQGRQNVVRAAVGYYGYYAGWKVHIVDPLGLNDPLLARLPMRYDPNWRVGHYRRTVPRGYAPGHDQPPEDPELAALYARIRFITRGPLFSPARLIDAAALQLFGPQIGDFAWRFPDAEGRTEGESGIRGPVRRTGMAVHIDPPRAEAATVRAAKGQAIHLVYTGGSEILATHDAVSDGAPVVFPPPPGVVDVLFVFPGERGRALQLDGIEVERPERR